MLSYLINPINPWLSARYGLDLVAKEKSVICFAFLKFFNKLLKQDTVSAADETVIHIRHITSTKTTSDTKKGNIDYLHFLIVVVFHQDGNQPKEPAGSAPWLNQTSQFISVIQMPSYIVSLNFWPMYPNKLLQHCWFP